MNDPEPDLCPARPAAVERIGRMVDRRTLLRYAGVAGLAAFLPAGLAACASRSARSARGDAHGGPPIGPADGAELLANLADRGPEPGKVLVALRLTGGHDGLDAVVPYADPAYSTVRKHLAHRPDTLLKLDDRFALHAACPTLARLWAARQVAIVHGVHHMLNDLSHFQSIDLWSTGVRDDSVRSGWLGRCLDVLAATQANPLWGMAIGYGLPTIMAGESEAPAAVPVMPTGVLWDRETRSSEPGLVAGLSRFSGEAAGFGASGRLVSDGQQRALQVADVAGPLMLEQEDDGLEAQLRQVARFVRAGLGTRVYHVTHTGDFDVHSRERDTQQALLAELDTALHRFFSDLGPEADRVLVLTWSEFGRRPEPNGSGTDHGTASVQFVIGPGIRGGHYGEAPTLRNLDDDGNVRATTDYRAVAATLVEKWLGLDIGPILPGVTQRIDFL